MERWRDGGMEGMSEVAASSFVGANSTDFESEAALLDCRSTLVLSF